MPEQIARSKRVLLPGGIQPASVRFDEGIIIAIGEWDDVPAGAPTIDAGDAVIMPGLVDAHVHVNEPGRTQWEGFETATRAAAAGGITTLVDMPLNSIPPTTTLAGFNEKLEAAQGKCSIDVAFWGGVVPGNTHELSPMIERGVRGFKCFLVHSGVDEFPNVDEPCLREAMPEIARLGSVLLVHAELAGPIERATSTLAGDPRHYQTFLRSRPREAENEAIELMIRSCRETGARVHIVHHSSSDALPMLRLARAEGLPMTVETCPHYLTFAAEEIADGATHYKCCPPVREKENREKLWDALADRTIDMIVSDHSPCTADLKLQESGDFMDAWGGIAALQFTLPVTWTEGSRRGFCLEDISRWMSAAPASLAGIDGRKGRLATGHDADFLIFDPDEEFTVTNDLIYFRNKLTPYEGMRLRGKVRETFLRGTKVLADRRFENTGTGRFMI